MKVKSESAPSPRALPRPWDSLGKNTGVGCHFLLQCMKVKSESALVAQRVKRLPAMTETWVQSLGQEDPLEKKKATHSSVLAWRIP